jgi:hypothetical protein
MDVRDRTGVPVAVLEALESGDYTGLNREQIALGLRRYGDLVGLDGEGMGGALGLDSRPDMVGAGARPGAAPAVAGAGLGADGFAGHLRQYPGSGQHLQAFTQTAQVPSVGGALPPGAWSAGGHDPYGSGQVYGTTGMYPATPPLRIRQVVRPAARPVRWLVWLTVALLVVAGTGLVLAHVKPAWIRTLHLVHVPDQGGQPAPPASSVPAGGQAGSTSTPGTRALVTTGVPGPTGTTVTVRAQAYTVLVQASSPCWVMATTPQGTAPVFNATMAPGTSQELTPANGQLSVELGASGVTVTVKVAGKTVSGWSYTPTSAPVTLLFTNSDTPTNP